MIRNKYSLVFILSGLLLAAAPASAQTTNAAPYCNPIFGGAATGSGISQVEYFSTVNTTARANNTYTFYNNLPAYPVTAGNGACFKVTCMGDNGSPRQIQLLVDWNGDIKFDSTSATGPGSENGSVFCGTGGGSCSVCATSPDTALNGETRARIMWTVERNACAGINTPHNGEIEDYRVNITGGKPIPRIVNNPLASDETEATVRGTVHANKGGATAVDFEYGQTTAYTNSISGGSTSADAHTLVSAVLPNVLPNTIYHYRVKCSNGNGTAYGRDQTFLTPSATGVGTWNPEDLSLHPNPAGGVVRLTGAQPGVCYTASLHDITGRLVAERTAAADGALQLDDLRKGMYLVRIREAVSGKAVHAARLILE